MASEKKVLLRGATILTLDPEGSVHRGGDLLIAEDGLIAGVGGPGDVEVSDASPEVVDLSGTILLPGLIQGHIHLGQTFFRGLCEGRKLLDWLRFRIWPLEAAHDDDSAYWCTLLGAAECLLGGTTTIQDIGLGPGVRGYLRALRESRLRGFGGKCLMDSGANLPDGLWEDTDTTLADTESIGLELATVGDGRLRYAVNPRFILSGSDELWQGVRDLAGKHGWPVHTHALEQREETEIVRSLKSGRDEIEYFDDAGILGTDLRIAHGVWLGAHHYSRLQRERFSVVHCASANLKLGSGIADVLGIRNAGIPVGLGCDGAACNNGLDGFQEIRLAALLQGWKHGPDRFGGLDALRLATNEGSRAIGLDDETGSLEVGKQADLVVLSTDAPEMWSPAAADPHDIVAYSATRARVRDVFVAGEQLVADGRLTHLDLDLIRERATSSVAALISRADLADPL